ncbi:MAG TPA: hypothetical protein VFM64_00405, partial [Candidatus Nitrosotenuis sp.]|nr:hypothetical protein [Candidatus Nitrosotenuis sp.]
MLELALVDQIRIVAAIIMLGIATASDIKNREISDIIWMVFGGIAVVLIVLSSNPFDELVNVGIAMIIAPAAIIIWRFGLF